MENDSTTPMGRVTRIDEGEIRGHLDKMVRGTVEETLNAMLDEEADQMCQAQRYERSPDGSIPEPATTSASCTPRQARLR